MVYDIDILIVIVGYLILRRRMTGKKVVICHSIWSDYRCHFKTSDELRRCQILSAAPNQVFSSN